MTRFFFATAQLSCSTSCVMCTNANTPTDTNKLLNVGRQRNKQMLNYVMKQCFSSEN